MTDYRARVIEIAKGEVGSDAVIGHPKVTAYWRAVLPPTWSDQQVLLYAKTKAWCGGFALYCLKQAGLAQDLFWKDGIGFLGPGGLHQTRTPSRGDVGYVAAPFQHHLLFDYERNGNVYSVDGNQPDVRERVRQRSAVTFYSIQPLVDAAEAASGQPKRDTMPVPKRPTVWLGHCNATTARELQSLLNTHGDNLEVDGAFGVKTDAAVRRFQIVRGLTSDGIVGESTWLALESAP